MKNLIGVLFLAVVLSGCGGAYWHDYVFLCRTQLEQPKESCDGREDYEVIACVTDYKCVEAARDSGLEAKMNAQGYALGCPKPNDGEVQR